jgi:predicted enzyme related to lactoylglutathione lyase
MHRSRLSGFVIDCHTADLDAAGRFWADALGMSARQDGEVGYLQLNSSAHGLNVLVQQVSHESRVHLDIETDNLEAEVTRLERLGAVRVAQIRHWWVMQAPTGQRFCVVGRSELAAGPGSNNWE